MAPKSHIFGGVYIAIFLLLIDPRVGISVPEPEVMAVMNWTLRHKFVASISLEGGALVAKYPYSKPQPQGGAWITPDQPMFKDLAATYAKYHNSMSQKQLSPCPDQPGECINTCITFIFSHFSLIKMECLLLNFCGSQKGVILIHII